MRRVGGARRVLIGASPDDAARVAQLLRGATDDLELATDLPARAVERAAEGAFDVLVLVWPNETDLHAELAIPIVLVASEFTEELASYAPQLRAAVCLFRHGGGPLREAVRRSGRVGATRLGAVFDHAPMGAALLDEEGRIVRANAALERFLGREPRSLVGVSLSELQDHGSPETIRELRDSVTDRTTEHQRLETRYRRGDGSSVHGLETLVRTTNGSLAMIEDASARVALEAAVRASESVRALVYVSVTDVVFFLRVVGDRYRFVEVNPAFLRATGLSEEQVVGRFVDEVIPEPSLSRVLARYREALTERRTVRWEEVTAYPTGKKYGEVSVTPLADADGVCRGLVGTVHDVTEVRTHEETIRLYADIVKAVQIGLTVWDVADPGDPSSVRLRAFNPMAQHSAALDLAGHVGSSLLAIFPGQGAALAELACSVARDRRVREQGSIRWGETTRSFAVKAFPLEGAAVGLALEDVTSETRARSLNAVEQRVLEGIASGDSLASTLETLVLAIEELAPPAIASVLLLSPDGKRVQHGAAPHLPAAFNQAIDGASIGPTAGSCGTAAYLRRSVIVTDIETDPLWREYRALALPLGLRACWSTPILGSDGRVLGTFALYYRESRTPTSDDMELIGRANHVAGIAIQRRDLDEQLRGLAARLEAAREEERTKIARDIHDELGQTLTALKMDIAWIGRRAMTPEGLEREAILDRVKQLSEMTDQLMNEVRRIASELRPGILDDLGLSAALAWEAEQFSQRTNIECLVRADIREELVGRDLATTVFRAFQEALTNVARHADAHQVVVSLTQPDDVLILEVHDDGKGIRAEAIHDPRSLGLVGIRERARRAGGTASFSRDDAGGTRVMLYLPLSAPPSRA